MKPKAKRPVRPASRKKQEAQARRFALAAARLVNDLHAQDVLLLDVRGKSDVTDFILIATGTSERQTRSVGHRIAELGAEMGMPRYNLNGAATTWLALDFVDVVVHLFDPVARGHYDLEMLWGDAPKIAWRKRIAPRTPSLKRE